MNRSRILDKKKILSTLICLVVVLAQNPMIVNAETVSTAPDQAAYTYTLEDFGQSSDDTYLGILVSRDYGFNLPTVWEYSLDAVLTLRFSHSPTLNEKSTLAVDWNDVRLGSAALTSENADGGELVVRIPAENLVQGYNVLHVEFYMGIADDFCIDVDNPAVWAVVHKSTSLKLTPKTVAPDVDLNVFPLPFIESSPVATNKITLIVPDKPGTGELNSLAAVGATLGKQSGGWLPIEVETMSLSDALKAEPEGNLIVVGTSDEIKKLSSSLAPNVEQTGAGVLVEQISPFDDTALILAVTGESQADVEKAGQALTNSDLYPRISGGTASIVELPAAASSQDLIGTSYTFEQLGYTDTAVYGSREQSVSFNIPLKALWQKNTDAVLDLHFIHSSLLSGDSFTLTVSINNLPVGSVVLKGASESDRHEVFQIPLSFFQTGVNFLTVQSSIQLSDDFSNDINYCTDEHYNRAWLTIVSDSQMTFPSTPDQVTANIANFPYTFIGESDLSQLAFVLPDTPKDSDLQVLSTLAVRIGQITEASSLWPHVLTAKAAAKQEEIYPYQLLIGMPLDNSAILDVGDDLPQPFDAKSGEALPVAELSTIDTSKIDTGYIEAFMTKNNVPNLVVSGNNAAGMALAAAQLGDAAQSALLVGDLAIVTSIDQAVYLWVTEESEQTSTVSQVVQNEQTLSIWFQPSGVLYAALAVLVVTVLILIIQVIITLKKGQGDR